MEPGESSLGSPDRRPCFYRIMLPENKTELDIPLEFFTDHLASEETRGVTLRGPCGSCVAELQLRKGKEQQREDEVYLVRGWRNFVKSHSIGLLEFMLFLYNGDMSFDVKIYGLNGWERNYETALQECAPSSAPPFPSFRKEMKSCNVGHKCTMLIPKAFARKNLPMCKQQMLLRDSDGISKSISIVVTSNGLLSLTGGWKDFTDAHSIKIGDVCVFELVEQNLMHVHIIRK